MMSLAEQINSVLTQALKPLEIQVVDESSLHEGHAGARPGGETHFRVRVVADAFRGKNRIERHRMVNELLSEQFAGRLHALSLSLSAPEEV
ncbi:MAG: BolA family protein [Micavibrio sp.]